MSAAELHTYEDAIAALDDFLQGHVAGHPTSSMRRNIQEAYNDIATAHDWSFLQVLGRVQLVAPQTDGSVAYDHTGGATCERQLTLTPDDAETWPTNAQDYSVRVDDLVCDIERRYSDTVVQLDAMVCPGADVAAGTTYSCWPRWYPLPSDFISMAETMDETWDWGLGVQISMREMQQRTRYDTDTGDVKRYAIGPAPDLHGVMALFVDPASDTTETLDFPYKRRPRQIRYTGTDTNDRAGTITLDSSSATVAGTDTAFTSAHVGAIIRTAGDTTYHPTGLEGAYPWVEQRSIIAVASATSATLDAAPSASHSSVKYTISDPIDLDVAAYRAFLWLAKVYAATERRMKDLQFVQAQYEIALRKAKMGDSRENQRRIAGPRRAYRRRLSDFLTNRTEA